MKSVTPRRRLKDLSALQSGGGNSTSSAAPRKLCTFGRGLSPERRAWTLGWTFGIGPVFAVLGSCGAQLVLSGNFFDVVRVEPVPPPWSYVILFGATGPAMLLSGALVWLAVLPPAPEPEQVEPEEHPGQETVEYDVEAEQAGGGEREEDVLEETPEFLQDTPDHDRLWFEQRPPRDFDFDS